MTNDNKFGKRIGFNKENIYLQVPNGTGQYNVFVNSGPLNCFVRTSKKYFHRGFLLQMQIFLWTNIKVILRQVCCLNHYLEMKKASLNIRQLELDLPKTGYSYEVVKVSHTYHVLMGDMVHHAIRGYRLEAVFHLLRAVGQATQRWGKHLEMDIWSNVPPPDAPVGQWRPTLDDDVPEQPWRDILSNFKYSVRKTQDKSSDVEPLTTANKAIHCLKWRGGGGYKANGKIILFWSGAPDGHFGKLFLIKNAKNFDKSPNSIYFK